MGIFSRFSRGDRAKVLEIIDDGREYVFTDMTRTGEVLADKIKQKEYAIVSDSVNLTVDNNLKKGRYHIYLVDPSVGATVSIGRDDTILKTRTNANLIGTVMSSRLLQQAFNIRPSIMSLLITGILGIIVGAFIGKIV
jgi:hypothetical protein